MNLPLQHVYLLLSWGLLKSSVRTGTEPKTVMIGSEKNFRTVGSYFLRTEFLQKPRSQTETELRTECPSLIVLVQRSPTYLDFLSLPCLNFDNGNDRMWASVPPDAPHPHSARYFKAHPHTVSVSLSLCGHRPDASARIGCPGASKSVLTNIHSIRDKIKW
jgi:hypothetical protein